MIDKPKILAVPVPWAIGSVPQFRASKSNGEQIDSIIFTAFFLLESADLAPFVDPSTVMIVDEPPPFSHSASAKGATYRRVRVEFDQPVFSEMNDHDEFPEQAYDWSSLPVYKHNARSVSEYRILAQQYWVAKGLAPNPGMYEISNSPLLNPLIISSGPYRHFVLIGEDQFFNVVAKDWRWEPGQVME